MKYCLAIDIGASSGRHILASVIDNKIVLEEIYRFPNSPVKKDGRLTWDTENLFKEILNGLKKAKEIGKIPSTIGIDTWGVDYALLDKDDNLIDCVYCYRDSRTVTSSKKAHEVIPFEKIYSSTGIEFAEFNTIYQLYDDVLTGRINNAETFLQIPDYFNYLLTGVKKNEYTNATTTALVNTVTHVWDEDIISKLGIKKSLFKKATGFVVEETTKEFVKDEDKMVLSKKKVTTKEFPPDSSAIKFLLELEKFNNNEFENLTDEQLHQEKLRLLNILKDEEIDS
jgi:rhamnulokinase